MTKNATTDGGEPIVVNAAKAGRRAADWRITDWFVTITCSKCQCTHTYERPQVFTERENRRQLNLRQTGSDPMWVSHPQTMPQPLAEMDLTPCSCGERYHYDDGVMRSLFDAAPPVKYNPKRDEPRKRKENKRGTHA